MAKLGDMVCTTPVFRALKTHDANMEVHVLGNAINKAVVAGSPDVDSYIIFGGFNQALTTIKTSHYDAVIIAGAPDVTSLAVAVLGGARCVVVPTVQPKVTPLGDVWYRLLARLAIGHPRGEGEYAPREYLRLLSTFGIHATDTTKHLYFTSEADNVAASYLERFSQKMIVGLTPSAGNKVKEWPPERFAQVAEYLVGAYDAEIIVFGATADKLEVEAMFSHISNATNIHNALETFSVEQLKAIISKLHLFISADTGPLYIAEAFGVPTIDIVGPIDEREQPPHGKNHRVIVPPGRTAPELSVMNAKWYDYAEARRQAEATPVALVLEVVDDLLASLGFAKKKT